MFKPWLWRDNAFVHSELDEEVYMRLITSWILKKVKGKSSQFCKITRSLYGLKLASHHWSNKFSSTLLQCEFARSMCDYSLFTCTQGFITILVHADDILITSNDLPSINKLKAGISWSIVQIRGYWSSQVFLRFGISSLFYWLLDFSV